MLSNPSGRIPSDNALFFGSCLLHLFIMSSFVIYLHFNQYLLETIVAIIYLYLHVNYLYLFHLSITSALSLFLPLCILYLRPFLSFFPIANPSAPQTSFTSNDDLNLFSLIVLQRNNRNTNT
ncbi:hypothetical protein VKT23_012160 [Stygiomarasmius scandens]|uniref:Uncharacterized protein n=1 Tax=Marasmiellus scandens TaxID=2682957 RepID=A0ABR1J731_9AGAR